MPVQDLWCEGSGAVNMGLKWVAIAEDMSDSTVKLWPAWARWGEASYLRPDLGVNANLRRGGTQVDGLTFLPIASI